MSEFSRIYQISRKIYAGRLRRWLSFFPRALLASKEISEVLNFFDADADRSEFLQETPILIDYVPRRLFYANSTLRERTDLIIRHFDLLQKKLGKRAFSLTNSEPIELWRTEIDGGETISLRLSGMRKEGLFSVELFFGDALIYNINAWLNRAKDADVPALWIGALQGTSADNAQEVIKKCAKALASYRPKNLILYVARAVARSLDCEKIYAVSNAGFYANNGMRIDRKLKTNLDDFWEETDGVKTDDARFYEIPTVEPRKSLEEMKPNKRSMYRKRFKILDEIDASVAAALV